MANPLEIAGRETLSQLEIAVAEATEFRGDIESVLFVCFDEETHAIYKRLLTRSHKS